MGRKVPRVVLYARIAELERELARLRGEPVPDDGAAIARLVKQEARAAGELGHWPSDEDYEREWREEIAELVTEARSILRALEEVIRVRAAPLDAPPAPA